MAGSVSGLGWDNLARLRLPRESRKVLGWVILNRVPLWYELWRRFNFFPPDYTEREPSIFEMFMPKTTGQGIK